MQPVSYRRRRNAASRTEREWRVEDDALVTRGGSGRERRMLWRDVVGVRLCDEPDRAKPWRYVFVIKFRQGHKVVIDNSHYVSSGVYEDRSTTYTPFVHAALARIAVENPKARALTGETPKRYFFGLLGALVGMGVVAYALIAVRTPLDALPYTAPIKLLIVLLMLPIFSLWMLKAMPRGVALDAVPPYVLPPAPAE